MIRNSLACFLVALAILIAASAQCAWRLEFEYFNVSAPSITLAPGESIYGFNVFAKGAVILRTKVPFQWDLSVDGSEGDRSALKAWAIVGASALGEDRAKYFHDFIEVGKIKDSGVPFDITITLSITNDRTGAERKLRLPLKQVVLKPSTPP